MTDTGRPRSRVADSGWDRGFEGHRRRQSGVGLRLTYSERLRWLEQTMEELRPMVGRARYGTPMEPGQGTPSPGSAS